MISEENLTRASRCMKALTHPIRLRIVDVLGEQEFNVQQLVEAVGTSQSNVSQHLTMMRDKGILSSRREGNQVFYSVGDCKILKLVSLMKETFCPTPGDVAPAPEVSDEAALSQA